MKRTPKSPRGGGGRFAYLPTVGAASLVLGTFLFLQISEYREIMLSLGEKRGGTRTSKAVAPFIPPTLQKLKPKMPIEEISIIGERNSGTRWTVSHVDTCFNHTLKVRERLIRHKHWFQHDVPNGRERVGTLVLAQFRNPYHWVEAMRNVPHHCPSHFKKGWKDFVSIPWTIDRPQSDLDTLKGNLTQFGKDETQIECQEYFTMNQIISCERRPYPEGYFKKKPPFSGHQPQYELRDDGSGMPYGSIVEMRSDKIKNHLNVSTWDWVQDYVVLRYEDLLANGTEFLIKHIEQVTGVEAKCKPFPAQDRKKRPLSRDYVNWMTKFAHWETEALIGYEPVGTAEKI